MQLPSDAQLLRDYAERHAENAFAELVQRYTDLVYSAALRQVYSPELARDVTQSVFTDLARKALTVSASLSPEASLIGWLYRGTRFAARDLYRNETRRTRRERQAMEQLQPTAETPPDWERLGPVLDDAMSELDDLDRDAVLLRYFKNHDLRTVGATLGISDDAAQKRVSRAVERLREFFAKRGVTVGASGLAVVLSANAVQAAPAGLATTISTAAVLTGTTLATTATITATKVIAMTALQKAIVTVTVAIVAGAGIYEARQAAQLRDQNQRLQHQQTPMAAQIKQFENERDEAINQLAALREDNQRLNRNTGEMLKLRGEISALRRQQTPDQDQQLVEGKTESEWIKSIVYFGDDDQTARWRSLGPKGIQMLLRALKCPSEEQDEEQENLNRVTRMKAASLLSQLKNDAKSAIPELINLLKTEKDNGVRAIEIGFFEGPIESMNETDKAALLPELIRALESEHGGVRNNALVALQYYSGQNDTVVPLMERSLQDSDPQVRFMAVKSLNQIAPQNPANSKFVSVLVGCVSGPSGNTAGTVADAVRMLGELHREPDLALPALIQSLQNADRYIRENSAVALGRFGQEATPAITALQKALEDSDASVRRQAAAAIAIIDSANHSK